MGWKNGSVLPPFQKKIVLILTFSVVIHGSLFAQKEPPLVFTDNDARGGLLTGDLIFTVPKKNPSKIKDYVIYWGNSRSRNRICKFWGKRGIIIYCWAREIEFPNFTFGWSSTFRSISSHLP